MLVNKRSFTLEHYIILFQLVNTFFGFFEEGRIFVYPLPERAVTGLSGLVGCGGVLEAVGGGGGIRTHGPLAGTTVFKTVTIDHSDTPPDLSPV